MGPARLRARRTAGRLAAATGELVLDARASGLRRGNLVGTEQRHHHSRNHHFKEVKKVKVAFVERKLIPSQHTYDIVYAQAILETNNFKSRIFNENNNLFGMKQAVKRITKARYTQYEHAYYKNWIESLDDYALYSSTYLSSLKTESDYFEYISQYYAEDSQYVTKLKKIIASMNLKSKFN